MFRRSRTSFIEKTLQHIVNAVEETVFAEATAMRRGLLQGIDAHVKLAGIVALIVSAIMIRRIDALAALFLLAIIFALASNISLTIIARRVWLPVLLFTAAIALPAIFLVPGSAVLRLPVLGWPITLQGLVSAAILMLRTESASTLAVLLVMCTRWNHLFRALRFFRLPRTAVLILEMTYRYAFVLMRTSQDMFEARSARVIGAFEASEQRRLTAGTVGVLLDKSLQLSMDVETAMQARGFRGEINLLNDFRFGGSQAIQLTFFLAIASAFIWLGR